MKKTTPVLWAGFAAIAALGASPAHATRIDLFDYGFNVDGDVIFGGEGPLPAGLDASGFDFETGLGSLRFTVTGAGQHNVLVAFDHDIDSDINGSFNEAARTGGALAGGLTWEADALESDIFDHVLTNALDNANNVPSGSPDDVVMALGWDFGLLTGRTAVATFFVDTVNNAPGFFLNQFDPDSFAAELPGPNELFFWATLEAADAPPQPVIRVTRTDGTLLGETLPGGGLVLAGPADSNGAPGETLRFDATGSLPGTDPSSPITIYRWTVNDEPLGEQPAIVELDLADGRNSILLEVEDALGRVSTFSASVGLDIGAPVIVPVEAPTIFFDGSQVVSSVDIANEDQAPGETVEFDASQSASPEENPIVDFAWSVNDVEVQSGESSTASLALQDGENTIGLTVTYSMGNTGAVTITANVAANAGADIGTLTGLTPAERSMGIAISEICPALNNAETLTTGQRELRDRCNAILNDEDPNQQRGALEALTPEEITSQQSTGIDFSTSQLGNLASRLVALRSGAAGGLNVAGLSIRDGKGNLIPVQELAALANHLMGGASGDDDGEGASLAAKWGFFVNGNVVDGEKDETQNESGFDFGGWGVTAGVDYRFTDSFVAGLSLGYNESETDFAENGGNLDSEGVSTSLYGTFFNDNWYADFIGSSGSVDYDSLRRIVYSDADGLNNDTAFGTTSGDLATLGVSFGYDFTKGGWSFGPTVALTSLELDIDGFAETGGGVGDAVALRFGEQHAESRTAQGGFQAAYALSRQWGVLAPTMRVAFIKELENAAQVINVRFVNDPFTNDPTQPSPGAITVFTDDPDEEYLRWAFGVSFVRANGLSAFVDYEGLAGLDTVKSGELTFGVRFERSFD